MNDDKDISDQDSILILSENSDQNLINKTNNSILKINDLIKKKYLPVNYKEDKENNNIEKNFTEIKESALMLNNNIKEQTIQLTNSIESQKNKLQRLYREEVLFDQNKIQLDIINNQERLIEVYRKKNNQLKSNLDNTEKKLNNTNNSNRKFLINNNELKNTISRFIKHNKNLQNNIQQLKKDNFDNSSLFQTKLNEISSQIKFYQEENIRLSNEIVNIKKNYETTKHNFKEVENEKNNIYKKIKELNNSLLKNNIIGTPFLKETIVDDSINSKILNDISDINLKKEKEKDKEKVKKSEKFTDLDDQINNIFN